jgi:hypothetical protein
MMIRRSKHVRAHPAAAEVESPADDSSRKSIQTYNLGPCSNQLSNRISTSPLKLSKRRANETWSERT